MKRLSVIAILMLMQSCEQDPPRAEIGAEVPWVISDAKDWSELQLGGEGSAQWTDGVLRLDAGVEMTGSQYGGALPEIPYELELEARKMSGSDFFCGLTFPVSSAAECVTLVVGGWGGVTVGISSIDGKDASENETTSYGSFESEKWYAIRVTVKKGEVLAWVDGEEVVNLATEGRKLGLRRGAIESCAPLGLAAWQTGSEIRAVRWRSIPD